MLGRALDAAEEQEETRHCPPQTTTDSETTSLATGPLLDEYGSMTGAKSESGDSIVSPSTYDDGDDEDDDDEEEEPERNIVFKIIHAIKGFVLLVANVENLWDSPTRAIQPSSRWIVLFWFTSLASAYAAERTTFKLLVDRTGPFRLFSAVVLTGSHALLLSFGMLISKVMTTIPQGFPTLGIPIVDVGLMALLDTVHLLLVAISGSHVPPTLIVILVQLTIPLTALFTQLVHPDGCCSFSRNRSEDEPPSTDYITTATTSSSSSTTTTTVGRPIRGCGGIASEHIVGSLIITLAVLLGLAPAIISFFEPEIFIAMDVLPIRTALNTMVFTFACVPAAASQLYKEHVFLHHKQPVDSNQLNLFLSFFQFLFLLIISPLVYGLQGLGAYESWYTLYPSAQISNNFQDGIACFFGHFNQEESTYPEEAMCQYSSFIVLAHVVSIIVVGVAVDKIVNAGATKIMYRGISAGIILAVIALYTYDLHDPDFNYGPLIDSIHFVCTLTLILGSEVYHRVSLQDATFETVYREIENLYDDPDMM